MSEVEGRFLLDLVQKLELVGPRILVLVDPWEGRDQLGLDLLELIAPAISQCHQVQSANAIKCNGQCHHQVQSCAIECNRVHSSANYNVECVEIWISTVQLVLEIRNLRFLTAET